MIGSAATNSWFSVLVTQRHIKTRVSAELLTVVELNHENPNNPIHHGRSGGRRPDLSVRAHGDYRNPGDLLHAVGHLSFAAPPTTSLMASSSSEGALGWAVLVHEAAADLLPAEDLRLQGCVTACGEAGHAVKSEMQRGWRIKELGTELSAVERKLAQPRFKEREGGAGT